MLIKWAARDKKQDLPVTGRRRSRSKRNIPAKIIEIADGVPQNGDLLAEVFKQCFLGSLWPALPLISVGMPFLRCPSASNRRYDVAHCLFRLAVY